jgi:hypothetical protein
MSLINQLKEQKLNSIELSSNDSIKCHFIQLTIAYIKNEIYYTSIAISIINSDSNKNQLIFDFANKYNYDLKENEYNKKIYLSHSQKIDGNSNCVYFLEHYLKKMLRYFHLYNLIDIDDVIEIHYINDGKYRKNTNKCKFFI